MAFSGVKKQKKNELTVRFGQEPFVRLCPFVRVPILKKKGRRTLITFSKVKKKAKNKKKGTNLPFRSLRNRSFGFVRSSGLQSLKKKGKRTLITFSKVKKKTKKRNELPVPFTQEPFVRLCPFVRAPILKKKRKENVNYVL